MADDVVLWQVVMFELLNDNKNKEVKHHMRTDKHN
jgi:hypothetical protein